MFKPFSPFIQAEYQVLYSIKTNVRGILDSYHGDWDFLVEMLQNAVDAIEEKFAGGTPIANEKARIEIYINANAGTVRVSDNGIGIEIEEAKKILAPNFTTKPYYRSGERRSLRGHKGVGVTFLAFSTNYFRYCTKQSLQWFAGEMHDGKSWALDEEGDVEEPVVHPSDFKPDFLDGYSSGSSFEIRFEPQEIVRFGMTWLGWYNVIRSMTAAAFCDINELHSWNKDAIIKLRLIDSNGARVEPPDNYTDDLPMAFLYPHEKLVACNLDEYHDSHRGVTTVPAAEKSKYEALYVKWNTDKIEEFLFDRGNVETGTDRYQQYLFTRNHLPSIYALFTHTQRVWRERLDQDLSSDLRRRFWRPGVQIVTHQMPTGQMIDVSLPYRAGNKDRIFILVELEDVKPDYGRKGFKVDVNRYIQYAAAQTIEHFLKNRELLRPTSVAHGPTVTDAEARADQRINWASRLPDLNTKSLRFSKEPQYENDVIMLFGELIGRGFIRGFEILSTSSGSQYDAVVNYSFTMEPDKLVYNAEKNPLGIPKNNMAKNDLLLKNLEFKRSLDDIITNFEEEIKSPQQVRFVVAWDQGAMAESGYEVLDLTDSGMYQRREFHGETHKLCFDNTEIPVILIKRAIEVLVDHGLLS